MPLITLIIFGHFKNVIKRFLNHDLKVILLGLITKPVSIWELLIYIYIYMCVNLVVCLFIYNYLATPVVK